MTTNTCPCGKPAPHGHLCHTCLGELKANLRAIARDWPDLEDVLAKTPRFSTNGGRVVGKEQPLPINLHALNIRNDTKHILTSWATLILETHQNLTTPADSTPGLALWLAETTDWYTTNPWIIDMRNETIDLTKRIRRAIDRPATKQPLGPCPTTHTPQTEHTSDVCACTCHTGAGQCDIDCHPEQPIPAQTCGHELTTWANETHVRCDTCGTTHNTETLKLRYLDLVSELVLPMPELLAMFGAYTDNDRKKLQGNIRLWAHRGRITKRSIERDGVMVTAYRVGEILDRLNINERETA